MQENAREEYNWKTQRAYRFPIRLVPYTGGQRICIFRRFPFAQGQVHATGRVMGALATDQSGERQVSTIARVSRWIGLGLSVGLLASWLASTRWLFAYGSDNRRPGWTVGLSYGVLGLTIENSTYPMRWRSLEAQGWSMNESYGQNAMPARRLGLVWPTKKATQWSSFFRMPMWLPSVFVVTPTIVFFIVEARRRRACGSFHAVLHPRLGKAASLVFGVGSFVALLFVTETLIELMCFAIWGEDFNRTTLPDSSLNLHTAVPLFLMLFGSYVGARVVYSKTRWRQVKVAKIPTCSSCGYNLTGNVSGVCPECGSRCKPPGGEG